jgi:hypothetical protein
MQGSESRDILALRNVVAKVFPKDLWFKNKVVESQLSAAPGSKTRAHSVVWFARRYGRFDSLSAVGKSPGTF